MKTGIELVDGTLIFHEYPIQEVGPLKFCSSFSVGLDNIKIIAISPRLAFDDEILFVLIIDDKGEIHAMPDAAFKSSGLAELEKHFELDDLILEWEKFSYEDHYGNHDKIVFPKELYWQDLFENDLKSKFRKMIGGFISKSFSGNLSQEVKKKINSG